MVIVIAWVQLKYRVNSLAMVKSANLFRVLLDSFKNRVSGLALLISQGNVHMIWPTFWFMGEDVLLHSGKPERPRHTAHTGEQICLIGGVQRK